MIDKKRSKPTDSGVFHAGTEHFGAVATGMRQSDVTALKSLRGVLRRLGETLEFPDWYGGNLDALVDCLCDAELVAGRTPAVAITGLATLQAHDPEGFAGLLAALSAASEERAAAGHPLAVLIDVAAPGLPKFPAA